MKHRHNTKKRKQGFGALEAVTSSIFIIVAVILSLDCWFMITAARVTDAACRDAARAASQTTSSTAANDAAMAAVQPYAQYASRMMTAPQVSVNYNGSSTPPTVTVVTTVTVTPFVPLNFLNSTSEGFSFSQTYSFPVINSSVGVSATSG